MIAVLEGRIHHLHEYDAVVDKHLDHAFIDEDSHVQQLVFGQIELRVFRNPALNVFA